MKVIDQTILTEKEKEGTAEPMIHSHFFSFLLWQRAYHMPSPLQGTRTNFLNAMLKIGSGPTLQRGPCHMIVLLLPIKRRKNEGATRTPPERQRCK